MNRNNYLNIKVVSPLCLPGQIEHNTECIRQEIRLATQDRVDLLVFPELCLTGASCADLFAQPLLTQKATEALYDLALLTGAHPYLTVILGTIMENDYKLYNGAAILKDGRIQAFIPKTTLNSTEERWFARPTYLDFFTNTSINKQEISFGQQILQLPLSNQGENKKAVSDNPAIYQLNLDFAHDGCGLIHENPCAHVHVHLSANPSIAGSTRRTCDFLAEQSKAWKNIHVFAQTSCGESSSDHVFGGETAIFINGQEVWRQNQIDKTDDQIAQSVLCSLDNGNEAAKSARRLPKELLFPQCLPQTTITCNQGCTREKDIWTADKTAKNKRGLYPIYHAFPHHFSVQDFLWETAGLQTESELYYQEMFRLQVMGLRRRVQHLNVNKLVLGISGGLDSTLALLVACSCFDDLGLNRKGLICLTLPGFGTTNRTYQNACDLVRSLGCTLREISIVPAVKQHFIDIGHDLNQHDLTYENAQARERTQILMDIAGRENTFVVGTGDASELALGWCTFNGDHMSMYGVNASVPKTLIPLLLYTQCDTFPEVEETLLSIIHTPISPELLPLSDSGALQQKTEDSTGPYVLHDFFLYHHLLQKSGPKEIFTKACLCFNTAARTALDAYKPGFYIVHEQRETFAESDANLLLEAYPQFSKAEILHWLKTFYRRFFTQQFKRSCSPDGAQVSTISFSPRGSLHLAADLSPQLWINELEELGEFEA